MPDYSTRFQAGNQRARKYSTADAIGILEEILFWLQANPDAFLLNQPCNDLGYYVKLPSYLYNAHHKFSDRIIETAERIDSLLEERVVVKAAKGEIRETMGIFIAKVRHGWKDTQHIETTTKEKELPSYSGASVEALLAAREALQRLQAPQKPKDVEDAESEEM